MDDLDFEFFLNAASEAERIKHDAEEYQLMLDARFRDALEQYDPQPRYIDNDPQVQDQLQDVAAADIFLSLKESVEKPDDMSLEDFDERLQYQAKAIVAKRATNEATFTTRLLINVAGYEYASSSPEFDDEMYIAANKQLIADMIVLYEFGVNDPWVKFVDAFSPGESFDPNSLEDQVYMFNSLQTLANKEEDDRVNTERQLTIVHMICPDFDVETSDKALLDEYIKVLMLTTKLMLAAITERNVFEREAEVVELCAEYGLTENVRSDILAYLLSQYPAN